MVEYAKFIEFPEEFDPNYKTHSPAPVFQKRFHWSGDDVAMLSVCPLGLGCIYLNGHPVTRDLFIAPVSDYRKTLWYTEYCITPLLQNGENILTVILGNGFYNESLQTGWDFDTADWRGNPKLWLQITVRDQLVVASDESWQCSKAVSPILFNELRSGETYDCRIGEAFRTADCADWKQAVLSAKPPQGQLTLCECPPIRECDYTTPIASLVNARGNLLYEFKQNVSGYAALCLKGKAGQEITLRYAERIHPDGTLNHNGMDKEPFYRGSDFQTQRIILSGGEDRVTPRFSYFGFRYVEIEGATSDNVLEIYSVFVHQLLENKAWLHCSNPTINRLLDCARRSTLSNMFYTLTDCPTREKLGWLNDAVASMEQIYISLDAREFFKKFLHDIMDAITEEGEIPSIIPTWGWGLEKTTDCVGPLCSSIICELPVMIYETENDPAILDLTYPAMVKNLEWISRHEDEEGFIRFGLGDWMGPFDHKNPPAPKEFTVTAVYLRMMRLTLFAAYIIGVKNQELKAKYDALYRRFMARYYNKKTGRCNIHSQSAVAMMVDLRGASPQLADQLKETVLEKDCHHHCGMVSLRHLFRALDACGLNDLAYAIINAEGYPSYLHWMEEDGATTFYENWDFGKSNNHHMNTCVAAWIYKNILGLRMGEYGGLTVAPYFPEGMDHCEGMAYNSRVRWERTNDGVFYFADLDPGASLIVPKGYKFTGETHLHFGENLLYFEKEK